jgi:beta-N-acetylhexosaminidase
MSPSLRQKIAQTLCFGFRGANLDAAMELKSWLMHSDGIGSLILFDYDLSTKAYGKNIQSFEQLAKLTTEIKSYFQSKHPDDLQPWISIDVEGGRVDRLAQLKDYHPLPSAKTMACYSETERLELWHAHAKRLKSLNVDLNFAPVVDLDLSPEEGIFGPLERCFSSDPDFVTKCSKSYISVLNQHGILACLKHFPGHGSAKGDSHLDFVDVSNTFKLIELKPFANLIQDSNLDFAIMTAHVINRQLDPSGRPATLSELILKNLLRQEYGYKGLIISDDLQMQAISKYYSRRDAILQTFLAGADILIFGNQLAWDEPQDVIDEIEGLVEEKILPINIIDRAYQRILRYKLKIRE